jgi:ribonuclease P protein component
MAKQFSYGKAEKLKSRKLIEQLFSKGKTFIVFPIKVFYMPVDDKHDFRLKVGVGASSRNFKKATDRNRVKRLLREAYRTEKTLLLEHVKINEQKLALFFLYVDKTLPEYNLVKSKMQLVIERLTKQLHEKIPANT